MNCPCSDCNIRKNFAKDFDIHFGVMTACINAINISSN